jgi:hypothetical protein
VRIERRTELIHQPVEPVVLEAVAFPQRR